MKTIKLVEEDIIDTVDVIEDFVDTDENTLYLSLENKTNPFIESAELEEIRDILLDIDEDYELLLLNDDVVVLAKEVKLDTHLCIINEETNSFDLVKMPLNIEGIKNNETFVKYTPDTTFERHNQVIDILMGKLTDGEEELVTEEKGVEEEDSVNEEN